MNRIRSTLVIGACLGVLGTAWAGEGQEPADELRLLRTENTMLKSALEGQKKEIAALKKEIAALKRELKVRPTQEPSSQPAPGVAKIMRPTLDIPRSLDGLHARLEGKKVAVGFISRPLRIGTSGLVESIFVERIVDKTNMVAAIRFPELRHIEMPPIAPWALREGISRGTINPITPKAWQTGEERVWIRDIDTSGLIDNQVIYLTVPVKVVDTTDASGQTLFRVGPCKEMK